MFINVALSYDFERVNNRKENLGITCRRDERCFNNIPFVCAMARRDSIPRRPNAPQRRQNRAQAATANSYRRQSRFSAHVTRASANRERLCAVP